jgi:hypothetical protein
MRVMTELALFSMWSQLTYMRPHMARGTQLMRIARRKRDGLPRAILALTDDESRAWFQFRRRYLRMKPEDEVFVPDASLARVRIYEFDSLVTPESDA